MDRDVRLWVERSEVVHKAELEVPAHMTFPAKHVGATKRTSFFSQPLSRVFLFLFQLQAHKTTAFKYSDPSNLNHLSLLLLTSNSTTALFVQYLQYLERSSLILACCELIADLHTMAEFIGSVQG